MIHTIRCRCENEFDIDIPDPVPAGPGTETREQIISGDFLMYRCPECHAEIRPDIGFRIDPVDDDIISCIPEKERDRYLFESLPGEQSASVVIGFPELHERFLLLSEGIDYRAVELLKYRILIKAGGEKEVRIYFKQTIEDQFEFMIQGLRDDEIALIKIPRRAYEHARAQVEDSGDSEPMRTLFADPYISVHKLDLELDD